MNYNEVLEPILTDKVVRATKYISPRLTIKATRKRFQNKIIKGDYEIILSIGKPNYIEREFIKDCTKAGEPFPVKKVQLKLYNPPQQKLKPSKKSPK